MATTNLEDEAATPRRPTDANPEDAKIRDTCHEHLQALCLDLARYTLRSPDIELFHDSDQALFTHLADYFEQLKDRQAHEASVTVQRKHALHVLTDVYANAHQASAATNLAERKAMKTVQECAASPATAPAEATAALDAVASTAAGPLMSQRALREQLQAAGVNVAALSEVLELARFLDQKFGQTVPFGQVNVTHATAILITLVPCESLFDLIALVFEALPPTRGTIGTDGRPGSARGTVLYRASDVEKIRLFRCWEAIDPANAAALAELQLVLLNRPNLTLPLLLEVLPSVRHIHTAAHDTAVAQRAQEGKVVAYTGGAEEEGIGALVAGAPASSAGVVVSHDDVDGTAAAAENDAGDDGDDDSVDEELERERQAAAAAGGGGFWNALVAGPGDE